MWCYICNFFIKFIPFIYNIREKIDHNTVWKVSVFGVIVVQMREYTGQNKSKYVHFLCRVNYSFLQLKDGTFVLFLLHKNE